MEIDNDMMIALVATLAVVLAIRLLPRYLSGATYVPPEQLDERIRAGEDLAIIDVRTGGEFNGDLGHVPGAMNIPVQDLESKLLSLKEQLEPMKGETIYAVCRTDTRAGMAAKTLKKLGFKDVRVMQGGMIRWKREGRQAERG
jgi:rhodanese-related sulfurtransferase